MEGPGVGAQEAGRGRRKCRASAGLSAAAVLTRWPCSPAPAPAAFAAEPATGECGRGRGRGPGGRSGLPREGLGVAWPSAARRARAADSREDGGRMGRARTAGCRVPIRPPETARLHLVSREGARDLSARLSLLQTSFSLSTWTSGGSYARARGDRPRAILTRMGTALGSVPPARPCPVLVAGVSPVRAQDRSRWVRLPARVVHKFHGRICAFGGTRLCRPCHLCVLPVPVPAAGWLGMEGQEVWKVLGVLFSPAVRSHT